MNLQQVLDYSNDTFKGDHEQDFYSEEDQNLNFKPKKFRFQKYFVTEKCISELSDRNLLIKFLIVIRNEIHNQDSKDQHKILTKLLQDKHQLFWIVFSKYDGLVSCKKIHVQKIQAIKILPLVGFPALKRISVQEIPFSSFESFSWMNAPLLLEIRIMKCQVTRLNGLDKANFPRLMRIFLAENHIIDHHKMSRIHLSKQIQSSDLRFVIRDRFFELGQSMGDETFYNQEEIFASLQEFNNLNFIVKIEAINVVQNCLRILDGYSDVFANLFKFHIFQGRGRSEDQIRAFWRKRPLVEYSFLSLSKRLDSVFYQLMKELEDIVLEKVINRCGPVKQWI